MISRLSHYFLGTAFLCFFLTSSSIAGEISGLLDGMTFVGNNGEKGRELDPEEYEEITFQSGLFRSISCDPYNFSSSEYSTTVVDSIIHFEATTESPTNGKIVWQGVVDGSTAEVSFIWTKERWYWDTRKEYWFRGTLKE
ncbi:MAG: hypothetical protein KBT66_00940 [Amphritea sp.]|nr:hypothetical protein [Amphritea sp.]MBQ0782773.1 hypothetical protein [Amphritea sp.]